MTKTWRIKFTVDGSPDSILHHASVEPTLREAADPVYIHLFRKPPTVTLGSTGIITGMAAEALLKAQGVVILRVEPAGLASQ